MRFHFTLGSTLIVMLFTAICAGAFAAESAISVLPGLGKRVEFWKQIFTRYGSDDVVFFDPFDPSKTYSVLHVPDTDEGRAMIERERARIVADYALNEEDVRSQRGVKEQFILGLKLSGRYIAQMQKIFRDEGLPAELAYLPLVESSFNVRARSSVGAVGMWQFMPDTGKKFLRITDAVDERRDPIVSTRAAARLLKENHRLLGNWPLAITAYNHGTEGLLRASDTVDTQDLVEIIRRYQSPTFGFASKNFYAEFLAAVDIAQNRETYFPLLRPHPPLNLHEVEIKRSVPVQSLLKPTAVSQKDFLEWNPALSPAAKIIPAGYRVKVPPEKVDRFAMTQRHTNSEVKNKGVTVANPTNARSAARQRSVTGKAVVKSKQARSTSVAAARKSSRLSGSKEITAARRLKLASR
jgi:membrane-bound lytic murein transglycosylase D